MTFTKQIWSFIFYVLYLHGHSNTVIRGEEEAPETHQVRAVLYRRVAVPCGCHSPVLTCSACVTVTALRSPCQHPDLPV